MSKWSKTLLLVATALVLLVVNWSIYQKEEHLAKGQTLFLELAPVDPRSLMQGDYMVLRFAVSAQINSALQSEEPRRSPNHDGYAVFTVDENHLGSFDRLLGENESVSGLPENQLAVEYRRRNGRIKFATNAFFFQEGHAQKYANAEYGRFRVNLSGEPLLQGLAGENFVLMGKEE